MISFIIPVYNKESILFKTLTSLLGNLKKNSITEFEIIIINDGSTDTSLKEAIRFKRFNGDTSKIKIFHYAKNIGKGFALKYGFSKSQGDPVIFLDADIDIDTIQVMRALHAYERGDSHIVIGSKYHWRSRIQYPLIRFIYSVILRIIIKVLFNL